jgi:hypothetical protein
LADKNQIVVTRVAEIPVKARGRLVKRARYHWLLLAESHLTPNSLGLGVADCGAAAANGTAEARVSNRSARKGARDGVVSEVLAARPADPGSEVASRESEQF